MNSYLIKARSMKFELTCLTFIVLHVSSTKMSSEVKKVLQKTDAVCFDVDSTVIQEEGIDELAKFYNKGPEVSNLTMKTMAGSLTFEDYIKSHLEVVQPTLKQMQDFIKIKHFTLSPGVKKLVSLLHSRYIPVYLVSGGYKCIIAPIAAQLNISYEHIFANRLKFYYTGEYAGFNDNEPTSKSGGKAVVIDSLKKQHNYQNVVHIGDGITDLEASPPADAFIGYGGNVIRPAVQAKAKWFVTDFNEIINVLNQGIDQR